MVSTRRPVYFNPSARSWTAPCALPDGMAQLIDNFHRQFSDKPTRLVRLDTIAKEAGVGAVYVKDESSRFGLSAFKILGASWGTFRALAGKLKLSLDTDLETTKRALAAHPISLYSASAGNHGWAVARVGAVFSIPVHVWVPAGTHHSTVRRIEGEGATVIVSEGSYDDAIEEAKEAADGSGGLLVQDVGIQGYEDIPKWIVDGYMTMMREIDNQLDISPDLVVSPVGVGSLAQAVVSHYKGEGHDTAVLAAEPDAAPCLWASLNAGKMVEVATPPTIIAGLKCGTVSTIAWPLLRHGVDASVTISDYEAQAAIDSLKAAGVSAGPCGGTPLAALRRLTLSDKAKLGLNDKSVVVLICSEGSRDYAPPRSVAANDVASLTQALVQIDSANPSLGSVPGSGETEIAGYIAAWLAHRNIEAHWIEPIKGRPSIVGVVRGSGGGKSLLLNGHIDTVTLLGYRGDPLSGEIHQGKLYGRGAQDMKGGVAAALIALASAKDQGLRGDVIFAGVADEEATSIGTEQVLQAGWRADGAIVSEPTDLEIHHAHKGFVWLEVDIHGVAAHGSRPDLGIDAIVQAGHFLLELEKYSHRLRQRTPDMADAPSVHASVIKGGEEISSYPALCTVLLERRTVAGETVKLVKGEVQRILSSLQEGNADFKYDLRVTFDRPAFEISVDHPFVSFVGDVVAQTMNKAPTFSKMTAWTDCALLSQAGIPCLLWGPRGAGLHGKEEWVDVESLQQVADGLSLVATRFCA